MKKTIYILSITVLVLFIVACSNKKKTTKTTSTTKYNSSTNVTTTEDIDADDCIINRSGIDEKDIIEIDYFTWDPEVIEEKMVCKYQQLYPNIKINYRKDIVQDARAASMDYTPYLLHLASTIDYIPDVFQISSMESAVNGKLLMDFSEIWNNDSDTEHLFAGIAEQGMYGEHKLAMVNGQVMRGVMINKTLLQRLNFNLVNYGLNLNTGQIWTVDQMIQLARDFTSQARATFNNNYYYGIDGDYGQLGFNLFLPAIYNPNFGHYSIDLRANRFDFTSTESKWIDAYQLEIDLLLEGIRPNMTDDEKLLEFGKLVNWNDLFFEQGRTLLYHTYTYDFPFIRTTDDFEFIFVPMPRGNNQEDTSRTFAGIGLVGLSKKLENDPLKAKAAYDFAKFVTWSEEGYLYRIEFNLEENEVIPKYPVSDYESLWNRIIEIYCDSSSEFYVDGLDIVINNLLESSEVVIGIDKTFPGINSFKNWVQYSKTESKRDEIMKGTIRVADIAQIWEEKANQFKDEWWDIYEQYPNYVRP